MKVANEDVFYEIPDESRLLADGSWDIPNVGNMAYGPMTKVNDGDREALIKAEIDLILERYGKRLDEIIVERRPVGVRIDVADRLIIVVLLFNAEDSQSRRMRLNLVKPLDAAGGLSIVLKVPSRNYSKPLAAF